MKLHRTESGFYLILWRWRLHVTLKKLATVKIPPPPLPPNP